jgi:MOSC domain-containing protein YiiM
MEVLSVNVSPGRQVEHNGKVVGTGIFKEPVGGPVAIGRLGLEGDRQVDTRVHGGPDKAVYAYAHEHYGTWAEELGRDDLIRGQFGENLTVTGLLEADVHIGDRFRVGSALLEVTQPRVPCFKLGIKMGDATFPKRFLKSKRAGWYYRVIEEGTVQAGDAIAVEARDPHALSIHALCTLRYENYNDREALHRAAAIPALSKEWRRELEGL